MTHGYTPPPNPFDPWHAPGEGVPRVDTLMKRLFYTCAYPDGFRVHTKAFWL